MRSTQMLAKITKYNAVRSAWKQKFVLPEGLIHNPAPAAPSAHDTPAAFLPSTDGRTVRKDAHDVDTSTMPIIGRQPQRTYHLTAADATEIQRLRAENPAKWTRKALAEKYGVSGKVIGMVSEPAPEYRTEMQQRLETIKSMWGEKTARARDHRQKRKAKWLGDA